MLTKQCLCCYRFGFIQFESPEEAQGELDRCGGAGGTVSIDGRDIKINYAHTKEQKGTYQNSNIWEYHNRQKQICILV